MGAKAAIPVEEYLHTSFPDLNREYRDDEFLERTTTDYLYGSTQALMQFSVDPGPTPRLSYTFTDADPVHIRLSLLMLDDIVLTGVSGEVFTLIGQRLKKESPGNHTVIITHANGSSGYIPNDAAFDQISYEITASHLKPGCAEGAIVNGFRT
jgi:hypothetical protein